MRQILFATTNPHKTNEVRSILAPLGIDVLSLESLESVPEEPEETEETFAGNARLKARYYAERTGVASLAEDSGLEVDALSGAPGVHSARYAGTSGTRASGIARTTRSCSGSSVVSPVPRGRRASSAPFASRPPTAPSSKRRLARTRGKSRTRRGTKRLRVRPAPLPPGRRSNERRASARREECALAPWQGGTRSCCAPHRTHALNWPREGHPRAPSPASFCTPELARRVRSNEAGRVPSWRLRPGGWCSAKPLLHSPRERPAHQGISFRGRAPASARPRGTQVRAPSRPQLQDRRRGLGSGGSEDRMVSRLRGRGRRVSSARGGARSPLLERDSGPRESDQRTPGPLGVGAPEAPAPVARAHHRPRDV